MTTSYDTPANRFESRRTDNTDRSATDAATDTVVSRHLTSEGVVTYYRSPDGQLYAEVRRWNGDTGVRIGDRRAEARCA